MNKNGFKNKSERNAGHVTEAMKIFSGKKILNERPPEMDKETYQFLRKMQTNILKELFHKGHSPNRKLQGVMGIKQPSVRIQSVPKRRITTPRKAS